jgi:hypothetical protein
MGNISFNSIGDGNGNGNGNSISKVDGSCDGNSYRNSQRNTEFDGKGLIAGAAPLYFPLLSKINSTNCNFVPNSALVTHSYQLS